MLITWFDSSGAITRAWDLLPRTLTTCSSSDLAVAPLARSRIQLSELGGERKIPFHFEMEQAIGPGSLHADKVLIWCGEMGRSGGLLCLCEYIPGPAQTAQLQMNWLENELGGRCHNVVFVSHSVLAALCT